MEEWVEAARVTCSVGGVKSLFCTDSVHQPITRGVRGVHRCFDNNLFLLLTALHRHIVRTSWISAREIKPPSFYLHHVSERTEHDEQKAAVLFIIV